MHAGAGPGDRSASDDGNGLGYDAFCRCQDFENFRFTDPVGRAPDRRRHRAHRARQHGSESYNVTLILDYRQDRWLVADIQEADEQPLAVRALRHEIASRGTRFRVEGGVGSDRYAAGRQCRGHLGPKQFRLTQ